MSTTKIHEHWGTKLGMLMAVAGSAVGLGSLWRFPYMAGTNGGGAFVFLYLIFTFFLGLPVFLAEVVVGRRSQKSAVLAYSELSQSPNWRILGWLNVTTSLLILSYYSVISGWCLSYTLMSLNQFAQGKSTREIQAVFEVLFTSPGINVFWFALFLLINMGIVFSGIRKGIEYWSKILMPALFIILIVLFLYAITLPGFIEAAKYVFQPDFSKLSSSSVLNALGMAFFTLSVGLGIIVTYGSYMQPNDNISSNGLVITIMTVFVSLIAALTIFPIVFTFGFSPQAGPGLVFQTLPVLFSKMPASILISTVFFALLLFAALTSTISLLEVLVANFKEVFGMKRSHAALLSTGLTFIIGLPSALSGSKVLFPNWEQIYGKNFFNTMEYITGSWFMPIAALFTTIYVGWRYKKSEVYDEFVKGTKAKWIVSPWFFIVKYIAPLAVIIIILQEAGIIHI